MNTKEGMTLIFVTTFLIQLILPLSILRTQAQEFYPLDYAGNFALSFDGTGDYLSCGLSQVFQQQELTIESWIKPKYSIQLGSNTLYGHTYGDVVGYYHAGGGGWWLQFDYSIGALYFRWDSPNQGHRAYLSNRAVWYNTSWYHIAVTFDPTLPSNNLKFYVNGTLDSQRNDSNAITYATTLFEIGSFGGGSYGGLVDEVRLWNASRTVSEIQESMPRILNSTEITDPDLIGYWPFDDGSGTTSHDYSIQGNDAALAPNPDTPQWTSLGAPIVPEFPSSSVLFFVLIVVTSIAILARRRGLRTENQRVFPEKRKQMFR